MTLRRRLLILLFIATAAIESPGQTTADSIVADTSATATSAPARLRYDSTSITTRTPDAAALRSYRADRDFIYEKVEKPADNIIEKLWYFLMALLVKFFHNEVTGGTLPYLLFAAAVGLVIWKLIGAEKGGMFARRDRSKSLDAELVEENIHEMNFDELIAEAVAGGRFRRAVRLSYLALLKQMTDRGVIVWKIDKTNHDYATELAATDLRMRFEEATRLFDHVWYGDFAVDAESFAIIRRTFADVSGRLGGKP